MFDDVRSVLKRVLGLGSLLVLAIAILGALIGYFVAGGSGILAALVGSGAAFLFTALTILSVFLGSKLNIGGLLGLVLGGWLVKVVIFMVLFGYLNQADWLLREARPIVFFTVVAAVLAGLGLDTWIVSKARLSPAVKLP